MILLSSKTAKSCTICLVNLYHHEIVNYLEISIELKEDFRRGSGALKFNNPRLLSMERSLEASYKSKFAEVDKMKNLKGEQAHRERCVYYQ